MEQPTTGPKLAVVLLTGADLLNTKYIWQLYMSKIRLLFCLTGLTHSQVCCHSAVIVPT